jgi:hypothetical protein
VAIEPTGCEPGQGARHLETVTKSSPEIVAYDILPLPVHRRVSLHHRRRAIGVPAAERFLADSCCGVGAGGSALDVDPHHLVVITDAEQVHLVQPDPQLTHPRSIPFHRGSSILKAVNPQGRRAPVLRRVCSDPAHYRRPPIVCLAARGCSRDCSSACRRRLRSPPGRSPPDGSQLSAGGLQGGPRASSACRRRRTCGC